MDKDKLLAPRYKTASGMPEDDVPVNGESVHVRGLTRFEAMYMGSGQGVGTTESKMLHYGMVDPPLSEEEALAWMKVAPTGELSPVVSKIIELSGMGEDADKAAYKSVRDES